MSDDTDDLRKALMIGNKLQVEAIEGVMKQVTFNMSHMTLWPNIYEGYEIVDLHGGMKKGTISHDDRDVLFGMFNAVYNCRIIRDVQNVGGERIYVDSRPWINSAAT